MLAVFSGVKRKESAKRKRHTRTQLGNTELSARWWHHLKGLQFFDRQKFFSLVYVQIKNLILFSSPPRNFLSLFLKILVFSCLYGFLQSLRFFNGPFFKSRFSTPKLAIFVYPSILDDFHSRFDSTKLLFILEKGEWEKEEEKIS